MPTRRGARGDAAVPQSGAFAGRTGASVPVRLAVTAVTAGHGRDVSVHHDPDRPGECQWVYTPPEGSWTLAFRTREQAYGLAADCAAAARYAMLSRQVAHVSVLARVWAALVGRQPGVVEVEPPPHTFRSTADQVAWRHQWIAGGSRPRT